MEPMAFGLILGLSMTLFFAPIIFLVALRARQRRQRRERDARPTHGVNDACEEWLDRTEMTTHTTVPNEVNIFPDLVDSRTENLPP